MSETRWFIAPENDLAKAHDRALYLREKDAEHYCQNLKGNTGKDWRVWPCDVTTRNCGRQEMPSCMAEGCERDAESGYYCREHEGVTREVPTLNPIKDWYESRGMRVPVDAGQ